MASIPVTFSGLQIIVDGSQVDIDLFKAKLDIAVTELHYKDKHYRFYPVFNDRFLRISFDHGSPLPRSPIVVNTITQKEEENPRTINQYEPNSEFAVIDFKMSYIWLKSNKNKEVIKLYLKSKLGLNTEIILKDIYDEQEFIDAIKKLDGIKLSANPGIFSATNTLSANLTDDLLGYEATRASIDLKYKKHTISSILRGKLTGLIRNKEAFKSITISGRDENGLGMLFNTDFFTRRISFNTTQDESGLLNHDEMFKKLTREIKNEYA